MIHPIDENFYRIMSEWWKSKGCEFAVPKEILPEGYVSYVGEKPVFAGYLFQNGLWGWLAFITVNPDTDARERESGMKSFVEGVEAKALEKGIRLLFSPTNNGSLISRLETNGFKKYDADVVHLLKIIT